MLDQLYLNEISRQCGKPLKDVEAAAKLLEDGSTIPFIARYRSYLIGAVDEIALGLVADGLTRFQKLDKKKVSVLASYEERQILGPGLKQRIEASLSESELEEICLPFKIKRKTKAQDARDSGLGPVCQAMLQARKGKDDPIQNFLKRSKLTKEEALQGVSEILAEEFSQNQRVRKKTRLQFQRYGQVSASLKKGANPGEADTYQNYYEFSKPARYLKAYQIMALLRGARENILSLKFFIPQEDRCFEHCLDIYNLRTHLRYFDLLSEAAWKGFKKKLLPSLEREIKSQLSDSAVESSLATFASNLKDLLLTRPIKGNIILGMDPGFKNGCKCAIIDDKGAMLDTFTIYPTLDSKRRENAKEVLRAKQRKFEPSLLAIGNGTACQETTQFVSDFIRELSDSSLPRPKFMQVSEAGASIYSASKQAIAEFGHLPIQVRGAISIARRVQDPLAEYVKIPIESLGVGLYQHDLPKSRLAESLQRVVESAVSQVGLDLNTASLELLSLLPGLNPRLAANILDLRRSLPSGFQSRKQLLKVDGIGETAFTQAAGFCRVPESKEVFDNTIVHPESYKIASRLLKAANLSPSDFEQNYENTRSRLNQVDSKNTAEILKEPEPLIRHVLDCLCSPINDPREDLPLPLLRDEILKFEALKPGHELPGIVRNIVEFGLFVDIGVNVDGLLHKSKAKNPNRDMQDQYSVGQPLVVIVSEVDSKRKRISLSELK
jgi:protein Tex